MHLCDERQHALQPHAPDAETPPVPGLMLKTHTISTLLLLRS